MVINVSLIPGFSGSITELRGVQVAFDQLNIKFCEYVAAELDESAHQSQPSNGIRQILQGLCMCRSFDRSLGCYPGTRKPTLDIIFDWADSPSSTNIFWLYGISGSGKTAIAHTVAATLDVQGNLGAAFFCNRYDIYSRDSYKILSTIVYQICLKYKPLRLYLEQWLERYQYNSNVPIHEFLNSASIILNMPTLVIVIDDLDECSGTDLLIQIKQVVQNCNWVKFFITSQVNNKIQELHEDHPVHSHDMFLYNSIDDINVLAEIKLKKIAPDIDTNSIYELAKRSMGVFQWVVFVVKYLDVSYSFNNDLNALLQKLQVTQSINNNAETSLSRLYTTLLDLNTQDISKKMYIKKFLSVARVLTEHDPVSLNIVLSIAGQNRLVSLLSLFFTVDSQSSARMNIVTSHNSIMYYLDDKLKSGEYWVDYEETKTVIVKWSLSILEEELKFNICNIKSSFDPDTLTSQIKENLNSVITEQLEFASYAWIEFLPDSITDVENGLDLVTKIEKFTSSPHLLFWMELFLVFNGVQSLHAICLSLYKKLKKVSDHVFFDMKKADCNVDFIQLHSKNRTEDSSVNCESCI
jgi:hypothetical protein